MTTITITTTVALILLLLVGVLTPSHAFSTRFITSTLRTTNSSNGNNGTLPNQRANEMINRVSTPRSNATRQRTTQQYMAPRFDPSTEKWIPSSDDETVSSAGYGPVGTLLRQGPKPFLIRLSNAQNYEQGVYKLMANEKMSVLEAMGNFDAYLENPNDWAYQYLVLGAGARALYCYNSGENFYQPLISLLSNQ